MEQFIALAAQKLGISEATARSATGAILQLLQNQMGQEESGELFSKLGGVGDLLSSGGEQQQSSSMMGGMMKMAGSLAGGQAGSALELTGKLKDSGLPPEQSGTLVTMLLDFIKQQAGGPWLEKILAQVPELKQLAS